MPNLLSGLLSGIFGKQTAQMRDAERIYTALLAHSRKPVFYGEHRVPDTYDGRIDFLTLHIAIILKAIRPFGADGRRLSQAIFDYMKDDFDVALREEGISDTGVSKRIKPMMKLFYTRLKTYDDALNTLAPNAPLYKAFEKGLLSVTEADTPVNKPVDTETFEVGGLSLEGEKFATQLAAFCVVCSDSLSQKSLGELALADFEFPEFKF